jgi:hypothetical protein
MPTAVTNGNVINLTVKAKGGSLTISMSLQRHHYCYCAWATAQTVNSLLYHDVTDQEVQADALRVGQRMEDLLNKNYAPQVLFGVSFLCPSGRRYLVDNSALNPKGFPNHFFVTSGPSVWNQMSMNEYNAALLIRRVEEAIAKKGSSTRMAYLDVKEMHKIAHQHGANNNPIVLAYAAAHTALNLVPAADSMLKQVSGQSQIVDVARQYY